MKIEQIRSVINEKKEKLQQGVEILSSDDGLPSELQAEWLTFLLSRMYVEHGIMKRKEKLLKDINDGTCKLWFAVRDGLPIGSAALIQQSDGSVEVGRAVSFEKGVGGLLMLSAASYHLSTAEGPIVAEVRLSDDFKGVPSGEATQTICFKHLRLNPQALVPAFNHGEPNRQEMFIFSSSNKIMAEGPIIFPEDKASLDFLVGTAIGLTNGSFKKEMSIKTSSEFQRKSGWSLVNKEPFSVIVPDGSGTKFEMTIREAENYSSFTLIPISTTVEHTSDILECLNNGFVPCGFDRNVDKDDHPIILLGKLKEGTLLAPIKIVSSYFTPEKIKSLNKIDSSFRSRLK